MRNRALTFRDRSETKEEKEAWGEVVAWFNSFLKPKYRITTRFGAIGLPVGVRKINEVFNIPADEGILIQVQENKKN